MRCRRRKKRNSEERNENKAKKKRKAMCDVKSGRMIDEKLIRWFEGYTPRN